MQRRARKQTGSEHSPERLKMFIGGEWIESEGGETFDATNPASGAVIATLPKGTRTDAQKAIDAANAARARIAKLSTWERSRLCTAIADVMQARRKGLAEALTTDQGKPYRAEAFKEVDAAIAGFREAAEQVKWFASEFIPVENPDKRVFNFRQPRGVYAVITPWNFPLAIPVEYLAPGLAVGNAIVWVPAPTTSVCAVRLMECIEEADVPPGVVNLVTGPGPVVGDEIVANPGTDAIGFTGSAETGVLIAQRGAGKPLLLEMGGNGPVIILDDADLDIACRAASIGCFANAGQICSSSERILVSDPVYDVITERLIEAAQDVRLGDPFDDGTTMGPLNNPDVAAKVAKHIADGVERGAEVLFGGRVRRDLGSEMFHEPTVLTNVALDSLLNLEETFGPVAPLVRVSDDEKILEIADRNTLGLVSSVYTRDIKRAFHFAERLRTGIVNINDTLYWERHIPFGGMSGKRSGIGRIGGKHTLMAMSDLKTVTFDLR
ncbi:MAG: aldehyde dehydrogenase family protein [Alphaproteobacteria bacterium]